MPQRVAPIAVPGWAGEPESDGPPEHGGLLISWRGPSPWRRFCLCSSGVVTRPEGHVYCH